MSRKSILYSTFIKKLNKDKNNVCGLDSFHFYMRQYSFLNAAVNQQKLSTEYFHKTRSTPRLQPLKQAIDHTRTHHHHECLSKLECWKCGKAINAELEQFFCSCGVMQPPIESRSYFQVFGMKENFDVDLHQLKQQFQKLQVLLHPDKSANKSPVKFLFLLKHNFHFFVEIKKLNSIKFNKIAKLSSILSK